MTCSVEQAQPGLTPGPPGTVPPCSDCLLLAELKVGLGTELSCHPSWGPGPAVGGQEQSQNEPVIPYGRGCGDDALEPDQLQEATAREAKGPSQPTRDRQVVRTFFILRARWALLRFFKKRGKI